MTAIAVCEIKLQQQFSSQDSRKKYTPGQSSTNAKKKHPILKYMYNLQIQSNFLSENSNLIIRVEHGKLFDSHVVKCR